MDKISQWHLHNVMTSAARNLLRNAKAHADGSTVNELPPWWLEQSTRAVQKSLLPTIMSFKIEPVIARVHASFLADQLVQSVSKSFSKSADNCGTGSGGFQPGNDCARGDGIGNDIPRNTGRSLAALLALKDSIPKQGKRMRVSDFVAVIDSNVDRLNLLVDGKINQQAIDQVSDYMVAAMDEAEAKDPTKKHFYDEYPELVDRLSQSVGTKMDLTPKAREYIKTEAGALSFQAMLAMTSQRQAPQKNLKAAIDIFNRYAEDGKLPPQVELAALIQSESGTLVAKNLIAWQKQVAKYGGGGVGVVAFHNQVLIKEYTVREFIAAGYKVTGENLDTPIKGVENRIRGAMVFGPKIGSFYLNFNGDPDQLTMDIWHARIMNRLTGNMGFSAERKVAAIQGVIDGLPRATKDELSELGMTRSDLRLSLKQAIQNNGVLAEADKKVISVFAVAGIDRKEKKSAFDKLINTASQSQYNAVASPRSGNERVAWRQAARAAIDKINARDGTAWTISHLQASLWGNERTTWVREFKIGGDRGGESYLVALNRLQTEGRTGVKDAEKPEKKSKKSKK